LYYNDGFGEYTHKNNIQPKGLKRSILTEWWKRRQCIIGTRYSAGLDRGTCPDTSERVYNHVLTS